jgi:5-formyltetrahydrofolate cyclo-ligase
MSHQLHKPTLRLAMRRALAAVSAEDRQQWSQEMVHCLQSQSSEWRSGATVALFGGLPSEPDLSPIVAWLAEHQFRVAYFAMLGDDLVPQRVRSVDDLTTGAFGVCVPRSHCEVVPVHDLDVVCVPGLAFDLQGGRLGHGRGYFDRLLAQLPSSTIRLGVGFELQVVRAVPMEKHDIPMTAIVTNAGFRYVG